MNNLKKGFTLIELLIAIAIVMLIATLGVPKIREVLAQSKDAKAVGFLGSVRTVKSSLLMENTMALGDESGEIELTWEKVFNVLDMKKESYIDLNLGTVLVGGSRIDKKSKVNYNSRIYIISTSENSNEMVGTKVMKIIVKDSSGASKEIENGDVLMNGGTKSFYVNKNDQLHLYDLSKGTSLFKDSFYSVEGKKWTSY